MGALTAIDLATNDYDIDLEKQLELHLTTNHYPPVPIEMVPVCLDAIDAVNSESNWDKDITLPHGITYKGSPTAPAHAIIEQHHLEFWIVESELD